MSEEEKQPSELSVLFWSTAEEKGFSPDTIDALFCWYLKQGAEDEREYEDNLLDRLGEDYTRNGWEAKFRNARWASTFLNLGGTSNLDTLERLIKRRFDERGRRIDEDVGEGR